MDERRFYRTVAEALRCDEQRAESIVYLVFQELRDRITPRESAHVAAQMPPGLKRLWLEDEVANRPVRRTHRSDFLGRLRQRGIFNHGEVTRLWQEHRTGQSDHRHRLWQMVMLELWFRTFIDQAGKQADTAIGIGTTDAHQTPVTA